jgi:hypothetical protein
VSRDGGEGDRGRDAPVDAVEADDLAWLVARIRNHDRRLAPAPAGELACQAAVEDEQIDEERLHRDEEKHGDEKDDARQCNA